MASHQLTQEVIWITGATSGLGEALAIQLAKQNNLVIASGRNQHKLLSLANQYSNIKPLVFDVTDRSQLQETRDQLVELSNGFRSEQSSASGHIDRVILNAGDCKYFELEDSLANDDLDSANWEAFDQMLDTNFFGAVNSIRIALPLLKKADRGHLVVISSMARLAPFPKAEAYGASKAALSYLVDSLRIDLKTTNIDITGIDPGFIDTPLTQKNQFEMPMLMPVDKAANRIVNTLVKRPFNYTFPKPLKLAFMMSQWIPKLWLKQF